ncbi:Glutathione biosynthesis bifunctional protein GshAB [Lentilactobacillus hilgardii]|uniref:glutamate--cysteine ligase n=1 Tax=Lentilactobacillus hilgardii TaxID=1588 RepID=UPI00019C50DA|nr:glutamate--cysteine ligase [Lentilactobacillus hilgardii]EEI20764.1 glutamate-cysteine ligase [Lentilactobacillus buchneri ATCC 11577]MCT3395064.1 glutamate--cysteine ligase [Lentilactobacillus hilgardii]QIR08216.1 Glutathione biosynthesis bifunctional protein GshAB [Lentilactobacillus hilgardii]
MFSEIGQLIFDNEAVAKTSDFTMGLEIEMQRVDETGELSQEPYPAGAGDEQINPWITNDFLETMSEVVTPPAAHALDAMHYLYGINNALRTALSPGELLWPLSMPPRLPKDKSRIPLAKMGPKKEAYLKEWLKRHSFSEGTPCGAHINLSIDPHVFNLVYDRMHDQFDSELDLQNYLYAKIAQGFLRYRWVITYLFGASPIAEANYFDKGQGPKAPIRSIRQSSHGFGNKFTGDYTNIQQYVNRIEQGVSDGKLISDYEFHGAVRFKGNTNLKELPKTGVQYLELRMLDLDPSSSVGIRTNTLRFFRLMASYFIMSPALKPDQVNAVVERADKMNEEVSEEHPNDISKYQASARAFLQRLEMYADKIQLGPEYQEEIEDLQDRVENPLSTPSAKMITHIKNNSLTDYALRRAKHYQASALQSIRPFKGFETNRKISANDLKHELFQGSWEPDKDKGQQ